MISRSPATVVRQLLLLACAIAVFLPAAPRSQGSTYTVYTSDGRRSLPYRSSRGVDLVPLEQVANLFNLSLTEDTLVGGLVVRGRNQTILLIPGQSFASVGPGRIVSLPAPVERERGAWHVAIDFVRQVLGPTLNVRVDIRRASRVLLIGDVRLPQVSGRFERQGAAGRLILDIQPTAPRRVTRQGNRVIIRFDAVGLDFAPVSGLARELITDIRVDGPSIVIDLGREAATMRSSDLDATHLLVELQPEAPPPPPPPPPAPPTPSPASPVAPPLPAAPGRAGGQDVARPPIAPTTPGLLRTIVLDPGHGGDDRGVVGPAGTVEKDYVLQFARRLKSAIESRIGLRVLLTRDADESVPVDRRAALANNNKADLFISLHANGSRRPGPRGAQVLSLAAATYHDPTAANAAPEVPVAFLGGGTRQIDVLPWDLAQIGFTRPSSVVRQILQRELAQASVPLFAGTDSELPLRPLVGASMPAILVELGFLSDPDDERDLTQAARQQKTVGAILDTLDRIRQGIPAQAGGAE